MLDCTSDSAMSPRRSSPQAKCVTPLPRGSPRKSWCPRESASENMALTRRGEHCTPTSLSAKSGVQLACRRLSRGKGTSVVVISLRSVFRGPAKRMPAVRCVSACAATLFMPSKELPLRRGAAGAAGGGEAAREAEAREAARGAALPGDAKG